MRYYIADCHFFHADLLQQMDKRGFSSVEQMNAYMISQWNNKVRKRDEVVILGDLSMGDADQTNEIIEQLQGKLYLVTGNHDNRYLRNKSFRRERFEWISPYAEMHDEGRKVVLSHYPMPCYNGQYSVNKKGESRAYMLYGHVHDTHDELLVRQFERLTKETEILDRERNLKNLHCNMINCFCMYSDYTPLSLDEWIVLQKQRFENK